MTITALNERGIATSRIVQGCMSLGGAWGGRYPVDAPMIRQAQSVIDAALEIGTTMFDHANVYKSGRAEAAFGAALKERPGLREHIVLQSKCGLRSGRYDFSKDHILGEVDLILERLGTTYLDILLLHRPDVLMEPEEVGEAFGKLKASGKVRYFGVSNMNASQMRMLQRAIPDHIAVNQLELGLHHLDWLDGGINVNQQAGTSTNHSEDLLEYCRTERVQIQARSPLAGGRFSGSPADNQSAEIQNTSELVRKLANQKDTTPEAIVLGWLLRHPARVQAVIGTVNPMRIAACAEAEKQADLMSREEWYELYVSARGNRLP